MKQRGKFAILVAVVLVAVLIIFLVTFQVRFNEAAIVYTFGRAGEPITEPGLRFKLPYPIQTVITYDKRTRIYEGKFQEYYTKDQHNLIVNLAVGWAIRDPRKYQDRAGSLAKAEERLAALVGGAANSIINSRVLADFVSVDPEHKYGDVERDIHQAIRKQALDDYGLDIPFVCITQLGLPEDVTKEVFERIRKERGTLAEEIRGKGKQLAEAIRAEADREASEIRTKAEAEAEAIRAEGDEKAAQSFLVFEKDIELAEFLRKLKTLRELRKRQTLIIDTTMPPYDLLSGDVKVPGAEPPAKAGPARPKADDK